MDTGASSGEGPLRRVTGPEGSPTPVGASCRAGLGEPKELVVGQAVSLLTMVATAGTCRAGEPYTDMG